MDAFFNNASSDHARATYESIEIEQHDPFSLGPYNTFHLLDDPKRIGFLFARYKFVAKMLQGQESVLEIGCQEGLGTQLVAKEVSRVLATDFYIPHIESCLKRLGDRVNNIEFIGHDIIEGPPCKDFDAAFSLDVLEHIDPSQENRYMTNVVSCLAPFGTFIVGMPSLESQQYASPGSKAGHINCKSGEQFRSFCRGYFHNVFMFGMNDEVVHTGFLPMSHYLFALCVHPKEALK